MAPLTPRSMNRPVSLLAGIALLAVALTVALWPSGAPDDDLGIVAQVQSEDETRSAAAAEEIEREEEAQREALDPSMVGIEDALIVTVIDEYKRPVTDVTVAITSTGELPIWVIDLGRKTDGRGRAVFDREKAISICEESGWEEVIIGVWDWKLRGFKTEKKIRLEDYHALTFELPGVQQILVKLHGFPDGITPVLSPVTGSALDAMELTGLLQRDGWWRFDEPPLGEVWDLWYAHSVVEEGTGVVSAGKMVDLPSEIQFVGPGVPGEIAKAEATLMDMPVVQGRLVDEQGKPFGIGRHERFLRVRGISDAGTLALQRFQFEYFSRGGFLAWPTGKREESEFEAMAQVLVNLGYVDSSELPAEEATLGLHQLQSLYFTWLPERSRRGISSDRLGTARDASVLLPLGQPGVDLGDVVLTPDNYLTKFRVVNEAGEPVPDADLDLELVAEGEPRGLGSTFLPDLETDSNGEAVLMAPSWRLIERTARGRSQERRPNFTALRVEVDSRQYIEHRVDVPIGASEVTITLKGGGSLIGDVLFSNGFSDRLRARVLSAGSPVYSEDDLGTDSVRPRRGRDTFRVRQLPEGTVDLVLDWGWASAWPIYVERGIPIRAGEDTQLATLAAAPIDLTMRWVEIEVPEGVASGSRATVVHDAARGVQYRNRVEARDGVWSFPIPVGSSRWTGSFGLSGFREFQVEGLGPGRHKLDLQELRSIVLKPSCGLSGYSDSWFIGVEDGRSRLLTLDGATGELILRLYEAQEMKLSWARQGSTHFEQIGVTTVRISDADLARGELVIDPPPGW